MWLMTGFGILMPAIRPPKTVKADDPRTMQIRARRSKDLDILRATYMPGTLGPTLYTPDKDYEYRAYCTPEAFALAAVRLITEIDYLKFKPVTEDRYADKALHDTYNRIWAVVFGELSTKAHQTQYWRDAPSSTTVRSTGVGWAGVEALYPDPLGLPAGATTDHRGGDYDRDAYNPEVWDEPTVVSTGDTVLDALYVEIDDLERALVEPVVVDHANCTHGNRQAARLRCRTNRIAAWRQRLTACRAEVDAYYDALSSSLAADIDQVAESDESVTVVVGESN